MIVPPKINKHFRQMQHQAEPLTSFYLELKNHDYQNDIDCFAGDMAVLMAKEKRKRHHR